MELFRNDKLGFNVVVFKYKEQIWIRAKDICISMDYKDYKRAIQKHGDSNDKKKPNCQDKRYRCYFLNKTGVLSLVNKSRKIKVKY